MNGQTMCWSFQLMSNLHKTVNRLAKNATPVLLAESHINMYIWFLLLIIYVDSSMVHLLCCWSHTHTHTHTHTQLALPRVIKIEEEIILFYSAGLLHSLKLTVDFDMAGTIWVIKERCVTKRSSFVWRGGCNPHFELLALPNLGTFLRDHKFYSYDVYKNCCWLLSVFTDFTSRHMCNYFRWKTITASHQLHVCQTSQL